jgi:Ca-activated chloride channel family protein
MSFNTIHINIARFCSAATFALALVCSTIAVADENIDILITSPQAGEPIFGQVSFAVEVFSNEGVQRVEFLVDGAVVDERAEPPYRIEVDVGQENREHRFEIRAHSTDGYTAEGFLVSPAIRVDMEVDASLQQLYVTVTRGGSRVKDLIPNDFAIIDNGKRQEIVTFARGDVRLTAAILVDSSSSMKDGRLQQALRGASVFARSLLKEDDASVLLFSDRLLRITPFSNDAAILQDHLRGAQARGGTALNDHLYMALKRLEQQQGRRVLILLSDGIDSHSALRMREVRWLARRSRALFYWIRVGEPDRQDTSRFSSWKDPAAYRREYRLLSETVAETGGRIVNLESIDQASHAFRDILEELREQYVLGFYPSVAKNDGSWHKVTIRLRKIGLQVRARDGYIDY